MDRTENADTLEPRERDAYQQRARQPMDHLIWFPMADAPRDGTDIIAINRDRSILFFIRWDGGRWMNGLIPFGEKIASQLDWRPIGSL